MSDTWRSFADRSKDINGLLARFYSDLTRSESTRYFGRRLTVISALVLGDVAACFIGIVAAHQVETLMNPLAGPSYWTHLPIIALILVFITVGLYSNSLSNPYRRFRRRGLGVLLFVALDAILAGLEVGLVNFIINASLISIFLLVTGYYAETIVRRCLMRLGLWSAPTAIIGCDSAAEKLYQKLSNEPDCGLRPIGFLITQDDDSVGNYQHLPAPVLGHVKDGPRIQLGIEYAVMTSKDQLAVAQSISQTTPTQLILLSSNIDDLPSLGSRTRTFGASVGIEFERDPYLFQNRLLKRAFDLIIAVPALVLLSPVITVFAALVYWIDRGNPFYVQMRVGQDGRMIKVPKLRSMYRDSDLRLEQHLKQSAEARAEWNKYFKLSNDPRILPHVGQLIRRSSVDELPQLWSVIIGDMSLVGPRPFPEYHLDSFDKEFRQVRHVVPPGLTGLWQVTDRSNGDLTVQKKQDLAYIRNWSLLLDLYILLETVPAVLFARGAK
ncbi:MAG: sugar transferase [Pseudomonadota bacterium]